MQTANWKKDDRIDWLLFRAQLEGPAFFDRVMDFEHADPQTYVNECSNAIFSLIKKEYDTPRKRALSATARLKAMPAMLEQGKRNLTRPVKLYAQLAIDSARSIDSLFDDSMMKALAIDLMPAEMHELASAREDAIKAIHDYAAWLEKRLPTMPAFAPMGEANYNYLLKHVYLLPLDAKQVEMLGQTELARARAAESMLPDPSLADPDPQRAKVVPRDQDDFLKAYESREAGFKITKPEGWQFLQVKTVALNLALPSASCGCCPPRPVPRTVCQSTPWADAARRARGVATIRLRSASCGPTR
jgi:hypothetical protein